MVDEGYLKIFGTKTTDNIIPAYNIGDVIKVDSIDTCLLYTSKDRGR